MSHWDEKYRANTIPWDRGEASPALSAWLAEGLLQPGRILIPGCGRGHEVLELARAGYEVCALDIAPSALQYLQARLDSAGVRAELVCADVLAWQPAQAFDAIYEQTCLCALDPGDWTRYERQLHAWLRPGGRLFVLFMQTGKAGGPPFHCALPEMQALFAPESWQWQDQPLREVAHSNGLFEYAAVLTRLP